MAKRTFSQLTFVDRTRHGNQPATRQPKPRHGNYRADTTSSTFTAHPRWSAPPGEFVRTDGRRSATGCPAARPRLRCHRSALMQSARSPLVGICEASVHPVRAVPTGNRRCIVVTSQQPAIALAGAEEM